MNLLNERLASIRRRKTILTHQIDELIKQKEALEKEEIAILKQLGVLYDDAGYE